MSAQQQPAGQNQNQAAGSQPGNQPVNGGAGQQPQRAAPAGRPPNQGRQNQPAGGAANARPVQEESKSAQWPAIDDRQALPDMRSGAIRSDLKSCGDKIAAACCASLRKKEEQEAFFKTFAEAFPEKAEKQKQLGLRIKVNETGSLLLDPDMKHPFVRIHIVDTNTGLYLAKKKCATEVGRQQDQGLQGRWEPRDRNGQPAGEARDYAPGVYNKESCAQVKYAEQGVGERQEKVQFQDREVDFLMPLATRFFDMRIRGHNSCQWNEEFIINEFADHILQPHVAILFEILEMNPAMIIKRDQRLNAENMYPIAWAYLRPLGAAHIHMTRSRLQLYRYKFEHSVKMRDSRPYDLRTPDVFLDFSFARRATYPSFLEVDLSFVNKSGVEIPRRHFARAPWEREVGLVPFSEEQETAKQEPEHLASGTGGDEDRRLQSREKFLDQDSILPNQRLWKFDTDSQGALKIEFSNKGKYLAIACTMASSKTEETDELDEDGNGKQKNNDTNKKIQSRGKTIIKIVDVETGGQPKVVLRGHHDLIHDMHWSQGDDYLVSASADGSAKVWNLTNKGENDSDAKNYAENDVTYFVEQLLHPSFVYAAKIHPEEIGGDADKTIPPEALIVATACFDQKIRIWKVPTGMAADKATSQLMVVDDWSILRLPLQTFEAKQSIYEADQLDDEALEMIMHPTRQTDVANPANLSRARQDKKPRKGTYFDDVYPNCLCFSESGTLFAGDSRGTISACSISLARGKDGDIKVNTQNHFKIQHKELEGDQINTITMHPEVQNQLFVQSRDNCVRLIEYESNRGPRIRKRLFGAQCKDLMVRCAVSPDGQYLISGSEDGKPYIWNTTLEEAQYVKNYQCKLLDLVSDCQWNPRYNMFALSGFGQNFPCLVYVYERTERELNDIRAAGGGISDFAPGSREQATGWKDNRARERQEQNPFSDGRSFKGDMRGSRGQSLGGFDQDQRASFASRQSNAKLNRSDGY